MDISCDFDGGNIEVLKASDPETIKLAIRKDNASDFFQWFYYRMDGVQGVALNMGLTNAAQASYPKGWENYRACASYDNETWFRVKSHFEDGELTIAHTPSHNTVYYAYFAPYPMERHAALIKHYAVMDKVTHEVLGQTLDGRDMDLLVVGAGAKTIWVDARQHPGETMAEWWMEGFLERLTDIEDPLALELLGRATFYVVPNMNPDGGYRGNLRTNAAGANLNREWGIATLERSPEVKLVMDKMAETGIDLALDVHGDEALPYNFIAGAEGVPDFSPKDQALLDKFLAAYKDATPAFQTKIGYPITAPGQANMSIATNWLAYTHKCLAMTLEMPFKDDANHPDETFGWSPERAAQLGHDVLPAMLALVDDI